MVERIGGVAEKGGVESSYHATVMDFGLAREISRDKGLTESGVVMGTPSYMSPEQARGGGRYVDPRSDVYSLGATLYHLLAGQPPFDDESLVNLVLKIINDDIPPLRLKLPNLPAALDTIVSKCLNKEADQRYQTAQALAQDLGRFLANQRILGKKVSLLYRLRYRARRNPPLVVVGAALLLSLICLGAVLWRSGSRNWSSNILFRHSGIWQPAVPGPVTRRIMPRGSSRCTRRTTIARCAAPRES